jgi:predicted phage terminase large subunit-like protein
VFEAEIAKRLPDLIIERSIQLQKQYNCVAWAVETVQFQEFMYTELLKRSAQRNVSFPAIPVKPTTDKDLRIQSLSPQVNNGFIRLHNSQGVLIEQLTHYPEADHDDGPDALEMLWQIAKTYSAPYEYMGADDLDDEDEDY